MNYSDKYALIKTAFILGPAGAITGTIASPEGEKAEGSFHGYHRGLGAELGMGAGAAGAVAHSVRRGLNAPRPNLRRILEHPSSSLSTLGRYLKYFTPSRKALLLSILGGGAGGLGLANLILGKAPWSKDKDSVKSAALTLNNPALEEEGLNATALTDFLNSTRAYKPSEADMNDNAPGLVDFLNTKPKMNPAATDSSAVGWGTSDVLNRYNSSRPWYKKLFDALRGNK